ncbi:hypothetical protein GGS20DRAFT_215393 [Poronia punctata]|nr:hypothetical protein GGS20DRAFT_215393 [Poronia punctata]
MCCPFFHLLSLSFPSFRVTRGVSSYHLLLPISLYTVSHMKHNGTCPFVPISTYTTSIGQGLDPFSWVKTDSIHVCIRVYVGRLMLSEIVKSTSHHIISHPPPPRGETRPHPILFPFFPVLYIPPLYTPTSPPKQVLILLDIKLEAENLQQ